MKLADIQNLTDRLKFIEEDGGSISDLKIIVASMLGLLAVLCEPEESRATTKEPAQAEPLKVGDLVQIVPEWQDPGDNQFERIVIEVPDDCSRVLIRTIIPGFTIHPTEWIEADHLILLPPMTND